MKLNVIVGGEKRSVNLRREDDRVFANVDGRDVSLDVSQPEKGVYIVRDGAAVREFYISPDGTSVSYNGRDRDVVVIDPKNSFGVARGSGSLDGVIEIKTAMPGKVVKVIVAVNDNVRSGDAVIVVEAMKMQNEIRSPKDGTVKEVRFSDGDTVAAGDVLAVIE